jgi:hypothetical protein
MADRAGGQDSPDFIGERGETRPLDPMIKQPRGFRLGLTSTQKLEGRNATRGPELIRTSDSARPDRVRKFVSFVDQPANTKTARRRSLCCRNNSISDR